VDAEQNVLLHAGGNDNAIVVQDQTVLFVEFVGEGTVGV